MNWILDFDDTLAVGPNTWALTQVIPDLVRDNRLPFEKAQFDTVVLRAQQLASETSNDQVVIDEMFSRLNWPADLKHELIRRMYQEYVPTLYGDTLPFLNRLAESKANVYIVSNNNHVPHITAQLGIDSFFAGIFTPKLCNEARIKPHRDMWDYMISADIVAHDAPAVVVGDDPWSEGAFADNCGHSCWIVDRMKRFDSLHQSLPYRWAVSLLDIHPD